jgi:hypothetical protein
VAANNWLAPTVILAGGSGVTAIEDIIPLDEDEDVAVVEIEDVIVDACFEQAVTVKAAVNPTIRQ